MSVNPVVATCAPAILGLTYTFFQTMKERYGSLHYGNEATTFEAAFHKAKHATLDQPAIAAGKVH